MESVRATEASKAHVAKPSGVVACESWARPGLSPLEQGIREGDNPVCVQVCCLGRPRNGVELFGIAAQSGW